MNSITNKNWSDYFWLRSTGFPFESIENLGIFKDDELLKEIIVLEDKIKNSTDIEDKELLELKNKFESSKNQFQEKYFLEMLNIKPNFISIVKESSFREALYLSNPDALLRIDSMVEKGISSINSRIRQRIKLAWNYIQRLYTKNDTISFFGPITWGTFNGKEDQIVCRALNDASWIAQRKVKFEYWVINSLIDKISEIFKIHIPLQLNSSCSIKDGTLYYPLNKSKKLTNIQNKIIKTINKNNSFCFLTLCKKLSNDGFLKEDIEQNLNLFVSKNIIIQTFNIIPMDEQPLIELCIKVQKLEACEPLLLKKWIDIINQLEQLRSNFESADLAQRKEIIAKIYDILKQNEIDTDRQKGSMYVGRYPIYEDCLRNLNIELPKKVSYSIQKELEPVMFLYSALVNEVTKELNKRYIDCWEKSLEDKFSNSVDFLLFLTNMNALVKIDEVIKEFKDEITKSWQKLFKDKDNKTEIVLDMNDINNLIDLISKSSTDNYNVKHFSKEIHSPDFMISAKSIEDINNNNYEIVIGEVHPAVHTVSQPVAQPFCPYKVEIKKEIEGFAKNGLTIVADSLKTYQRSHIDWVNFKNLNRIILPSGVIDEKSNSIRSGSCYIQRENNSLLVKSKEKDINEELLSVIPTQLHEICFALASDLIGKTIKSRLKIGNVVLKRRSWIINGSELPIENKILDESDGFLIWFKWKEKKLMPRYVFVKNVSEQKPIFVDFNNPYSLELLAYMANKKEDMFFTEMYPDPDNLWLNDQRGRYCSEFRTSYVN